MQENLAGAEKYQAELLERDQRMLYINCVVSGTHKIAYVDSGAWTQGRTFQ